MVYDWPFHLLALKLPDSRQSPLTKLMSFTSNDKSSLVVESSKSSKRNKAVKKALTVGTKWPNLIRLVLLRKIMCDY